MTERNTVEKIMLDVEIATVIDGLITAEMRKHRKPYFRRPVFRSWGVAQCAVPSRPVSPVLVVFMIIAGAFILGLALLG